jgi:hypothetical protein
MRVLLGSLVDYAGLFPPAALAMDDAVAEYAAQRRSGDAWMLGRFVAPAGRLDDLLESARRVPLPPEREAGSSPGRPGERWPVSALLGAEVREEVAALVSFNERAAPGLHVDTVEMKARTPREAEAALQVLHPGLTPYVEVDLSSDVPALLDVLSKRGARAKVRTGGVTPEAFPETGDLARFIAACARVHVAFKATAGLHHPVRGPQPLTYAADGPRGVMHGFLNVFGAAAIAWGGGSVEEIEAVLREDRPEAFRLEGDGLRIGDRVIPASAIASAREGFAMSFGSCSFEEPVRDLRALGLV